jgi:hypothetical protein
MARRLTVLLAATPVVAIALVASGCGGSSPTAASTTTTSTTTTTGGAAATATATAAFRACLAKAGVNLPSGFGNGRPPQGGSGQAPPGAGQAPPTGRQPSFSAKQRRAFASCQSKLPAGARGGGFPRGGQSNPALAKYTSCLRKHGVTLGASNNQSAFKKASAACAKYAPTAGG